MRISLPFFILMPKNAGIQADAMKQKMENLTNARDLILITEGTYNTVCTLTTLCIPVFGFPVSLVLNPRMKITILEVPPALTQRLEYSVLMPHSSIKTHNNRERLAEMELTYCCRRGKKGLRWKMRGENQKTNVE